MPMTVAAGPAASAIVSCTVIPGSVILERFRMSQVGGSTTLTSRPARAASRKRQAR